MNSQPALPDSNITAALAEAHENSVQRVTASSRFLKRVNSLLELHESKSETQAFLPKLPTRLERLQNRYLVDAASNRANAKLNETNRFKVAVDSQAKTQTRLPAFSSILYALPNETGDGKATREHLASLGMEAPDSERISQGPPPATPQEIERLFNRSPLTEVLYQSTTGYNQEAKSTLDKDGLPINVFVLPGTADDSPAGAQSLLSVLSQAHQRKSDIATLRITQSAVIPKKDLETHKVIPVLVALCIAACLLLLFLIT